MRDELLNTYLNDHLAGSSAAVKLIEHCRANNPEGALHAFLSQLLVDVKEDKAVLEDLSDRIGGKENPAKKGAAWLLEKMRRLKRNKNFFGYSDLARLEELEALALGVQGKLTLWVTLEAVCRLDDRFSGVDFQRLQERARRQHDQVENYRIEAAHKAFSPGT